ncbi:MAG: nuclear transport factor 2 family protein, partial [Bacteroidetes bacterium]|nr:nuclear transport factor 2 family protein [Bacteroidota bacterium]MBU1578209.1 nuclear transport factor 2 family protein [Bacteroidota bacterium]
MPKAKKTDAASKVYATYWDSYTKGDLETFASTLDDNYEMIGTSEAEVCHTKAGGIAFLKAQIAEIDGKADLRNRQIKVVPVDQLMLVNEHSDIYVFADSAWNFYSKIRISTWLRETETGWKVLQQHGSVPDIRVGEGETLAIDKINRENLELRDAVKRRTAELERKNWELEIESALERVRTMAMGMKKPDDLLDVCRIISQQLEKLKVGNIRNVQVAIIDEPKKIYANYQYFSAYAKSVFEETVYTDNPASSEMVAVMQKSANSFFIGSIKGEELEKFSAWRKKYDQFPDPIMDELSEVFYYFYSIGEGGLGLTTYEAISEHELDIFKRFHLVFKLAYRRFMDIQLAEAQAREAQIDAAIARVRAQSMAMYCTDDIIHVNKEMLDQLKYLQVDGLTGASIYLVDEDDMVKVWDISSPGSISNPGSYTFSYDAKKYPVLGGWVETWRSSNQDYFVMDFPKETLLEAVEEFKELLPEMAGHFKNAIDSGKLTHQWNPAGRLSAGLLSIDLTIPPTEDTKNIVTKMAGAFNLAYQRFLDLQKAEAQAREAQLELSLERIRSQVTAMRESAELLDIVVMMRKEFVTLGHEAHYFWHMRWLPEKYEKAMTSGDGTRIGMVMTLPRHIHGDVKLVADWEKSGAPTLVFPMDTETAVDYVHKMITLGDFEKVDPQAPTLDDIRHIGGLTFVMARTTHGEIGFSLPGSVPNPSAAAIETLMRFAGVFDLAYKRFEDLKAAEYQHREAQIELALERVRARTMAMQHSDELAEASGVLDEQVRALGIETWGCAFHIYTDDADGDYEWFSSENGNLPFYKTPRDNFFLRIYEKGQLGKITHSVEFAGEDCKAHYDYLKTLPVLGDSLKTLEKSGVSLPTYQIDHIAFFKHGYVLFITYKKVPEAHKIFHRFAKVFEQTYTRFLDLQKAEAQALKTQIELSLERIRSQVTSMQESSDLFDIVVSMRKEFISLGHEADYFWHMRWLPDVYEMSMTSEDGHRLGMVIKVPGFVHDQIPGLSEWEKGNKPIYVLALDAADAWDYIENMNTHGDYEQVDPNAPTRDDIQQLGGLTFIIARTTHGEIGYSLPGMVPEPPKEAMDTLVRFARVF